VRGVSEWVGKRVASTASGHGHSGHGLARDRTPVIDPKGSTMHTKSDENRMRRAAKREGYLLRKSRSRDPVRPRWGLPG